MTRHRALPSDLRDRIAIVVSDNAADLLRYLRRRVTAADDAADLLGHVLLRLWENGAKVPTTDEAARMWCFGIARNVLREHARQGVKQLRLADALRRHLRDHPHPHNSADALAASAFTVQTVHVALASLDEQSRELIMLIHWDGFSISDAARLLSMNPSTARTRYARAKERLALLLQARGITAPSRAEK